MPHQCRLYTQYRCWSIACQVSHNHIQEPEILLTIISRSHRIYHEAHYQLRQRNKFVFANFGSDLAAIASSIGLFKCRSGACGYKPLSPLLVDVKFHLGDEHLPDHADDKVHAFGCALRHLRSEITISSLHIQLGYHTFSNSAQLSWFASTLDKIKVQDKVTFVGDESFLDLSFEDLPSSLGMNVTPVYTCFEPYNLEIEYSPCSFNRRYEREKHVDDDAKP